jgi:hypothetical protein
MRAAVERWDARFAVILAPLSTIPEAALGRTYPRGLSNLALHSARARL